MLFSFVGILVAAPSLVACCASGFHAVRMHALHGHAKPIMKRQEDTITVPTKNTTHWTVAENLREMQVTDDAFNAEDFQHFNHALNVTVYNPGGLIANLSEHFTDLSLTYAMFPGIEVQNHNYPLRFGEGDWTVTMTQVFGRNMGPITGLDGNYIPPTERYMSSDFMTIGRWEYGLLQEEYLYQDAVREYRQLGLLPGPPPDAPDIQFSLTGDVGPDASALNKMHANLSDTALNAGPTNASQLFYSANMTVYGLTEYPMNLTQYLAYLQGTRQTFPDIQYVHQQVIAQGEWTATLGMLSGTQRGPWNLPPYVAAAPIPPTNETFSLLHYVISKWDNGEIVDMRVNFDTFGVLDALWIEI